MAFILCGCIYSILPRVVYEYETWTHSPASSSHQSHTVVSTHVCVCVCVRVRVCVCMYVYFKSSNPGMCEQKCNGKKCCIKQPRSSN